MKKLFVLLATLALLFASCQKQELDGSAGTQNASFVASVEAFEVPTKTVLAPGNYVAWSSGDRIAIFQGSTLADEYQITDASIESGNASFDIVEDNSDVNGSFSAGTELPCNVAFYPYADGLNLSGNMESGGATFYSIANVVVPSTQVYAANSFANGAFSMVAVTENMKDHNLKFKNVLGAMKLQFKGTQVVKSIKVQGANGEKLSGAATVTAYSNNLTPAIKMSSDASTEVLLDCGDGIQLSESEATAFYIALPPVLFQNGFAITVTDTKGVSQDVIAESANTVLRSGILVMPEYTLEAPKDDTDVPALDGDYVDEYGVNHGPGVNIDGVVWAPVNCGYHATDYQWGKLYQWGRKYGQGYDGDATTPEFSEGGVSLWVGQSETNINVFFQGSFNLKVYDWLSQSNDALWNSGTEESPEKTENDPCPEGWRVPTYAELNGLCQNRSSVTTNKNGQSGYWFSGLSVYSETVPQVFFSTAGSRGYTGGKSSGRDFDGLYWSSRPQGNDEAYYLDVIPYIDDGYAYIDYMYRACGYSVRCVQDLNSSESGGDVSGDDNEDELIIPVSYVNLNTSSLMLYEGNLAQLSATVGPKDATYNTVEWRSKDASVATVDQLGMVTAVSEGSTEIYAIADGRLATCVVTVKVPAVAIADYIDEYGLNHGKGIAVGMTVWAPVNCGYHEEDYQWGKLYQWGRKYGQGYDTNDATTPEFKEGGVSLIGGNHKDNANVFYYGSSDWVDPRDNTLWNMGTEESPIKTDYDPCPEGWRVPTYNELSELYQNRSNWITNEKDQPGYWFSGASFYTESVPQVFFPAAGRRLYDYGGLTGRGATGYYWSSKPFYTFYAAYCSFYNGSESMNSSLYARAYGYSVRCVQE